jgi:uncharacterized RDD family membrane protein YckC
MTRAEIKPKPGSDTADAGEPAPLARRLAALCYDALLLAALLFAFTLLVVFLRGGQAIPPGTPWYEAGLLGVALAFCGLCWTHGGQTLGMQAWRIRVVAADGGAVSWPRAVLRFFASWLALLPAGLGYWWALVDARRRCWHDLLSGTRVIRAR